MYRLAIQADPKNSANFLALARLEVFNGNYTDAVSQAENALLLNSNNALAYAVRGWALGMEADYLNGEASLKKALEIDPSNALAYAYYSELLANESNTSDAALGTLDKAVEMSHQAVNFGPNLLETHRARGLVLEMTANYPEAAREFEAAIAMNPNIADLHLALGRNYRFLQQYSQAVEEFNRANALNPADPMADTYISRTYATIGEYSKAIQYADQAVKISPLDPYMRGNLGVMYYHNKQYSDAIAPLRLSVQGGKADDGSDIKGLPLDYGRIAEYYYTFGLTLARTNQCGEALQISQMLMQGVKNDDISVYNAQEMINICMQTTPSADQGLTTTPGTITPETGITSLPTLQSTSKPTLKATANPTAAKTPTP
jgi:tetratricopeptide (TPR) repeat protein